MARAARARQQSNRCTKQKAKKPSNMSDEASPIANAVDALHAPFARLMDDSNGSVNDPPDDSLSGESTDTSSIDSPAGEVVLNTDGSSDQPSSADQMVRDGTVAGPAVRTAGGQYRLRADDLVEASSSTSVHEEMDVDAEGTEERNEGQQEQKIDEKEEGELSDDTSQPVVDRRRPPSPQLSDEQKAQVSEEALLTAVRVAPRRPRDVEESIETTQDPRWTLTMYTDGSLSGRFAGVGIAFFVHNTWHHHAFFLGDAPDITRVELAAIKQAIKAAYAYLNDHPELPMELVAIKSDYQTGIEMLNTECGLPVANSGVWETPDEYDPKINEAFDFAPGDAWTARSHRPIAREIVKLGLALRDEFQVVVQVSYVQAHSGIEGNERADEAAVFGRIRGGQRDCKHGSQWVCRMDVARLGHPAFRDPPEPGERSSGIRYGAWQEVAPFMIFPAAIPVNQPLPNAVGGLIYTSPRNWAGVQYAQDRTPVMWLPITSQGWWDGIQAWRAGHR